MQTTSQYNNTIRQIQNINGCTRIQGKGLTKVISKSVAKASEVHMAI